MNKESIIKLNELLTEGGWVGTTAELTVIVEKVEKYEDIKKFIDAAKIRYEQSHNDINNQLDAFAQLESELINASKDFTYYNYYQNSNYILFFDGTDNNKSFVDYTFGNVSNYNYEPIRKSGDSDDTVCEKIVIANNKLSYSIDD
jgi:hypothetical protein